MKKQLIILAVLATIINSLAGCAGTNWPAVRRDAATILGKIAVAELRGLVADNLGSDYGHAAAAAAWGAVDVADIGQLVRDATGHPIAARAVQTIAAEALAKGGVSKGTVINAVATALSEAAFAGGK
ncbi:MAG: hypothetical protein WCR59_12220 [Planctomycetota bacterium]